VISTILILVPVTLFQRAFRDILEKMEFRISHMLVDEYQDTTPAQYCWWKMLVGNQAALYCGRLTMISRSTLGAGRARKNLAQLKEDFPAVEGGDARAEYAPPQASSRPPTPLSQQSDVFEKQLWQRVWGL